MADILELLKIEANELSLAFSKASLEGLGTPQEVSDRREAALKSFLEKYFPFPYRITKGNINDSFGARSASIDCLVINPNHPYTIDKDNKYSFIFAEGVDFAIELKPDLSTTSELNRALKQIESVKKLTRKKHYMQGNFMQTYGNITKDQTKTSLTIPSFIFCDNAFNDTRELVAKIVSYYCDNKISRIHQFDAIIINNLGIVFNSKKGSYIDIHNESEGLFYCEFGCDTFANFIFWLNRIPQTTMNISTPIINHYLNFDNQKFINYLDLNELLLAIE